MLKKYNIKLLSIFGKIDKSEADVYRKSTIRKSQGKVEI